MGLEMKQHIKMSQELRMTPQLQQAIKLLTLTRMELVDHIQQELVDNPLLEDAGDPRELADDATVERREPADEPGASTTERESAEAVMNEIDWEQYVENYSSPLPATSSGFQDDLPGVDQTLTRTADLTDHLLWQLGVTDATDEERSLAEEIIGNLDEDGYLRHISLAEIATQRSASIDDVEDALVLVQQLDPPGIGARDLAECLALQIEHVCPRDTLLKTVVRNHLSDLETKNYGAIARALGCTREEAMDAHRVITTLNPRPGRQYSSESATYIVPDIYIVWQDPAWIAVLNDDGLPKLRVSDLYRKAIRGQDRDAKSYVQEKMRNAHWFIRSIHQRQRTIVKVTESIIRFQRDFLDKGIGHLKPLVLREVADDIGMHESTISRVTTNKYVHTPRGIFELKFFFNSSIRSHGGDDVAAEAVKHLIRQVISQENPRRPHSDQKLVGILRADHDIDIARRTVAKYREAIGILPSSKRKQML